MILLQQITANLKFFSDSNYIYNIEKYVFMQAYHLLKFLYLVLDTKNYEKNRKNLKQREKSSPIK